eukprot:13551676-Heterocapsa_arctica.AAC.1
MPVSRRYHARLHTVALDSHPYTPIPLHPYTPIQSVSNNYITDCSFGPRWFDTAYHFCGFIPRTIPGFML